MQNIKHSLVYGITGFSELYNVTNNCLLLKQNHQTLKQQHYRNRK